MIGDIVTIYYPGDGVEAKSNSATYKGIKEFVHDARTGIISFKTQKHGTITTACPWRLKKGVELNEVEDADEAPAGNMARRPRFA